ncbi:hypothetical protein [Deinococcus ruber]|uniref:hypothetical protein n=1 Tax=Deinococcus ruber TaxID=1848197 RepID=UPI0016639C90|nr:hypothetical protein [Deinococcus ruber]
MTIYTRSGTFTGEMTRSTAEHPDHEAVRLCEEMGWEIETSVVLRDVMTQTGVRRFRHPLLVLPKHLVEGIGFPDDLLAQLSVEAVAQVAPFDHPHEDN